MKNLLFILGAFLLSSSAGASGLENNTTVNSVFRFNNSVIFVENGITFSVYPDGEFDFYIDNRVNVGANLNFGRGNITFNTGFDYSPFVQYDDYGAVIQIENVPVFYDYYGRVSRIGGINIWYNNGRLRRVGGLYVYYNNRGFFNRFRGFINVYNRHYVYNSFHGFFARPALGFCLVYDRPYRRFYNPIRYTFYRPYINNARRFYARVGNTYRYHHRPERERLYRNDRRVVARDNRGRRDSGYTRNEGRYRDNGKAVRSNRATPVARTNSRTENLRSNRNAAKVRSEDRSRGRSEGLVRNASSANTKRSVNRSADYRNEKRNSSRSVATRSEVKRSSGSRSVKRNAPVSRRSEVKRASDSRSVKRSSPVARRSESGKRTSTARKATQVKRGKEGKSRSSSARTVNTRSRRVQ